MIIMTITHWVKYMASMTSDASSAFSIDHLGIVSAVAKELGLVEKLDRRLPRYDVRRIVDSSPFETFGNAQCQPFALSVLQLVIVWALLRCMPTRMQQKTVYSNSFHACRISTQTDVMHAELFCIGILHRISRTDRYISLSF